MADGYIDLQFPDQADAVTKRQRFIDALETGIPGYIGADGNPEVVAGEGNAEIGADNETLATLVAASLFREIGRRLAGLQPQDATYAEATVTITAVDTAGYTIPAGTQVAIADQTFVLVADATIAAASSTVNATFTDLDAGAQGSDLTVDPVPITPLTYVDHYTLVGSTTGGVDAEGDDEFTDKLARYMPSAFGRPELADDFSARMALNTEIAASLVLDGYNADTTATGQDSTVTLAPRSSAGLPVSTDAKNDRKAFLEANKASGWDIFIIDPTYTTVDVAAEGTVWDGFDETAVLADVAAAIALFLNPSTWGMKGTEPSPTWVDDPVVLRSELTTAINNVQGFRHLTGLTLAAARAVTAVASTDVFTLTAHGMSNTDEITLSALDGGAPLLAGTTYFVRDVTANTFKLALTSGGTAINLTTDLASGLLHRPLSLADADVALAGVAKLPLPGVITVTAA